MKGQRAIDMAREQLSPALLRQYTEVVNNFVESAIDYQQLRFENHRWSERLSRAEAAVRRQQGVYIEVIIFILLMYVGSSSGTCEEEQRKE
jgi:hypothetical protein